MGRGPRRQQIFQDLCYPTEENDPLTASMGARYLDPLKSPLGERLRVFRASPGK